MSWTPAYFAIGEITKGTIHGLFFKTISVSQLESLYVGMSRDNNNPTGVSLRAEIIITSDTKIDVPNVAIAPYNAYMSVLYVADKASPNTLKRTIWVNTTKPLPAN